MRSRQSLFIPLALGVAALSLATTARAQVATFSTGGAGGAAGFVSKVGTLPVSDDAIRALIAAHASTVLQPGAEDNYVVLVVDANDQFVSARTSKAAVTTLHGDGASFAVGDSATTARVVLRTNMASAEAAAAATGTVMISKSDGDPHASGVMGTGVDMSDVAAMGMKRYAAGDLGAGLIMVSVIKLK